MKKSNFPTSKRRHPRTITIPGVVLFLLIAFAVAPNPLYSQGFPDPNAGTTLTLQVYLNGAPINIQSEDLRIYLSKEGDTTPPPPMDNIDWIKLADDKYTLKVMIQTVQAVPGDITGDGKVGLEDTIRTLQIVSGAAQ